MMVNSSGLSAIIFLYSGILCKNVISRSSLRATIGAPAASAVGPINVYTLHNTYNEGEIMTLEQKLGALGFVAAVGLGLTLLMGVNSMVLSRPVAMVTYPHYECVKVVTPEGEKPCSWLQAGQTHDKMLIDRVTY